MSTGISLDAGRIELDYCSNSMGIDHGCLFHEADRLMLFDAGSLTGTPAFQATFAAILPRLELLGYTLERARREYAIALKLAVQQLAQNGRLGVIGPPPEGYFSFAELLAIIRTINTDTDRIEPSPAGEKPPVILNEELLRRLPWYESDAFEIRMSGWASLSDDHYHSSRFLDGFDSYTALRLLAENPSNLERKVTWLYGPMVEAGYADLDDFNPGLGSGSCFLIVTEGSSDAAIIRHAISLLRPQVSDFIQYIDMEEGYPFSGTSFLHKFIQGLIAMRVPLNIVAIYDNDAEGLAGYRKTAALKLPSTYRVAMLPNLPEFASFPTVGPTGEAAADINHAAAAIECYLDLARKGLPPPKVRWGAFNPTVKKYQGALEGKTQFAKDFLKYRGKPGRRGTYDTRKIEAVVETILALCVDIAEKTACKGVDQRRR